MVTTCRPNPWSQRCRCGCHTGECPCIPKPRVARRYRDQPAWKCFFRSARRAEEINNLGSNGLSYLPVIVIFIGMARYMYPESKVSLTWPVDEMATLVVANASLLFAILRHFDTRVALDFKRGAGL
jgi:hypothetical protein